MIEFAPVLMAEQLDPMGGDQLRRKIERMGVKVHTGKNTREIVNGGGTARKTLHFADGSLLEVDFIVFSTGIRARGQVGASMRTGDRPPRRHRHQRLLPDIGSGRVRHR